MLIKNIMVSIIIPIKLRHLNNELYFYPFSNFDILESGIQLLCTMQQNVKRVCRYQRGNNKSMDRQYIVLSVSY
jgi:hypothetical protein